MLPILNKPIQNIECQSILWFWHFQILKLKKNIYQLQEKNKIIAIIPFEN